MMRALAGLLWVALGGTALFLAMLGLGDSLRAERNERESVLYFWLEPDGPPVRLALPAGASRVRLETMRVVPAGEQHDPLAVIPYRLGLVVTDGAESALLTREVQEETRISHVEKARGSGLSDQPPPTQEEAAVREETARDDTARDDTAPVETAFAPGGARAMLRDRSLQLTDNRVLRLDVPGEALARRTLSVQALRPEVQPAQSASESALRPSNPADQGALAGPVLLRAYAQRTLAPWEQTFRARGLGSRHAARISDQISWRPWQLFSAPEKQAVLARAWERLSAEGLEGPDFRVVPVWFTGMDSPPQVLPSPGRFFLSPSRDAALNLRGTGTLILARDDRLEPLPPEWTPPLDPGTGVSVHILSAGGSGALGEQVPRTCSLPEPGSRCELPLTLPAPSTLVFQVPGGHFLGVKLLLRGALEPVGAVLAEPVEEAGDGAVGGQTLLRVEPDVRTLQAWRLGPGLSPLEVRLPHPRGDVLSVVARAQLPPLFLEGQDPSQADGSASMPVPAPAALLTMTLKDEAGRVLQSVPCAVTGEPSRFEFYRELALRANRVGERQVCRVLYPPQAERLILTSDREVDLQLYERVPWIPMDAYEPPYVLDASAEVRWRYAPLRARTWEPVQPEDAELLWQTRRATRIATQVRLSEQEPVRAVGRPSHGRGMSLKPLSDPRQQELLERVEVSKAPLDPAEALSDVDGLLVALPHGRQTLMKLAGGPLRLLYRLPPAVIGEVAWLEVEGVAKPAQQVLARSGSMPMGSVRAGTRRVSLHAPPGEWLLEGEPLTAGPATGAPPVFKRKRVWALSRKEPLKVRLPLEGTARTIRMEVFAAADVVGPLALETRLDEGRPRLARSAFSGALSEGVHRHVLPLVGGAPRKLLDRLDSRLRPGVKLNHRLGQDLAPGPHTLTLSLVRGPQEVWVRFYVLDDTAESEPVRRVANVSLAW